MKDGSVREGGAGAGTVLPDQLCPGLAIVFCGTAAGTVSAVRGAYYAGPGNRFWQTLFTIGLTSQQYKPEDFPLLARHGIGFTDIAQKTHGSDASLKAGDFDVDGFKKRISAAAPQFIAFNGKKAASLALGISTGKIKYGLQETGIGRSQIIVLPSTSGAARRYWNLAPWHQLAQLSRGGWSNHSAIS